jgi:hypothetical protein
VPQLALNWLLRKPTASSVIIGARNEQQLRANLAAPSFALTSEQVARLDEASQIPAPYPYWHQRQFQNRNPVPPSYRPGSWLSGKYHVNQVIYAAAAIPGHGFALGLRNHRARSFCFRRTSARRRDGSNHFE